MLKYYRQRKGLTTRQLAESVEVVPATVLMYERGQFPIPYQTAVAMAKVLEIDRNLLFDEFAQFLDYPYSDTLYAIHIPKRYVPLLQLEYEFKKAQRMDGVQLAFALIIELWKLITGNNIEPSSPKPLSPALRQEVRKLDQTLKEYKLLCENQIDSAQELVSFIEKKSTDISALESKRQKIYNRIRRPKSEEEKEQNKSAARKISAKLKPLREDLKTAQSITERYPHILKLLETERAMEIQVKTKNRERNSER